MWNKLLDFLSQVFFLTKTTQQQAKDIEKLREEVKRLSEINQRLTADIRQLTERQVYTESQLVLALKNQRLELDNKLLRLELRLPPGTSKSGDEDAANK